VFGAAPLEDSILAVDITAVGQPVLAMLRRSDVKAWARPITVTSGHQATRAETGGWLVPKKELVSLLQILLQARRIKVPKSLPDADTLVQQLATFKAKVPAQDETLLDWRERPHDDMVLAVAIAAWQAQHQLEFGWY
jgi:hypothetical protein